MLRPALHDDEGGWWPTGVAGGGESFLDKLGMTGEAGAMGNDVGSDDGSRNRCGGRRRAIPRPARHDEGLSDVDLRVLRDIANRVLPKLGRSVVERTAAGVSTPIYRVRRGGTTLYLRLAETAEDSLGPEVLVHRCLRARGVLVPEVVHFEPFHEALNRSVMITTEIPGTPLTEAPRGIDLRPILIAAGRDLAQVAALEVAGFGWIRRDEPAATHLTAELPTLRDFVLTDLGVHLAVARRFLTAQEIRAVEIAIDRDTGWLDVAAGRLAHGDLDATHIYQRDGRYTGIIDFGEIRGADTLYDLGHVALHDGERLTTPLLPDLVAGFGGVIALPEDHAARIRRWSIIIGVRALARVADRPAERYRDHLVRAIRAALATGSS